MKRPANIHGRSDRSAPRQSCDLNPRNPDSGGSRPARKSAKNHIAIHSDPAKKEKDLMAVKSIGELCLEFETRRERLKTIYANLPKKWQRTISSVLEQLSPSIYSFLDVTVWFILSLIGVFSIEKKD